MKLLLLADGRSVHTHRYQAAMLKQGVKVTLASLERGDTVDILLKKKSVSNSLNYFFINRQIKELVRKLIPDIVNPHFASGYGFSTAVSKVWKKVPVVLHCLGSDILVSPHKSFAHKRRVIYALQKADNLFCDSQYIISEVRNLYQHDNIALIPWGVERRVVDMYDKRDAPSEDSDIPIRIIVPRPHQKVYNNCFIIESLGDLLKSGKIKISFPSWGDYYHDFQHLVAKLNLEKAVTFYPYLPHDQYCQMLGEYDIYLSATISDSSPASLLEAMGAGLFPIVGDIPGVREWVQDDNALLFDLESGKSLRDAVARYIDGLPELENIILQNHRAVRGKAIFEDNIRQTIEIMKHKLNHDS